MDGYTEYMDGYTEYMEKGKEQLKASKTLLIVLRGSKPLREKAAKAAGVKFDTLMGWIRDESEALLDIRILRTVSEYTTIEEDKLVEVQTSEKFA